MFTRPGLVWSGPGVILQISKWVWFGLVWIGLEGLGMKQGKTLLLLNPPHFNMRFPRNG